MPNTHQDPEKKHFPGTMACIVCHKTLPAIHDREQNHPDGAVVCITRGNYGSTVFDPVLREHYLEFNICDECLCSAAAQGLVAMGFPRMPLTPWTPGLEDEYP